MLDSRSMLRKGWMVLACIKRYHSNHPQVLGGVNFKPSTQKARCLGMIILGRDRNNKSSKSPEKKKHDFGYTLVQYIFHLFHHHHHPEVSWARSSRLIIILIDFTTKKIQSDLGCRHPMSWPHSAVPKKNASGDRHVWYTLQNHPNVTGYIRLYILYIISSIYNIYIYYYILYIYYI